MKLKRQWCVTVQVEGGERVEHTVRADTFEQGIALAIQEEIRCSGFAVVGLVKFIEYRERF